MNPNEILKVSFSWAIQYTSINKTALMSSSIIQPQQNLLGMGFFLNIDGVVERVTGLSAAGGVVRDEIGKWILGCNHFLGKCSAFDAELWGILDGLLLLQKQ
ncbi:hypothetical protein Golax_021386 [Gossypium laxum]|uniref:RNase H type-1 domain-containing protein n=1 Tax=Gossypium laxum TaxID=34288 RepID=A0A7J9AKV2_9ROSI|nr:hypothetical protein [Gossypium laxum]